VRLIAGRFFTTRDGPENVPVAILNQVMGTQ